MLGESNMPDLVSGPVFTMPTKWPDNRGGSGRDKMGRDTVADTTGQEC